ncbi:MAG: hypothetical protein J5757_02460 [Lachnospiraceae bacterium]|nr:hypothetical protein [Lachnospiraceae bacterium]
MQCLICGAKLSKQDVCLTCGTDIRLYREIIQTSNSYYNLGLERAKRRDLTGALTALHQCLNLNKKNYEARNLLGLIYYELGELVYALREWVISKNLNDKDNPADGYLKQVETTQKALSANLHRYNNALHYLEVGSRDLALLSLKRIVSKPYNNVKAYQLLALLYMQDGAYTKAERLLKRCAAIDCGDSTTIRYLEAINEARRNDTSLSDVVKGRFASEEDGVITPASAIREYSSYVVYAMYIAIGFLLGALLIYFIVVPSVRRIEQGEARAMLTDSLTQVSNLRTEIMRLQTDNSNLQDDVARLERSLSERENDASTATETISDLRKQIEEYQTLIGVMKMYVDEDYLKAMNAYLDLDSQSGDKVYAEAYRAIKDDMHEEMWYRLYYCGLRYRDQLDYERSIQYLLQANTLKPDSEPVLYYLALSYESVGDVNAMRECLNKLIAIDPESQWSAQAYTKLSNYQGR